MFAISAEHPLAEEAVIIMQRWQNSCMNVKRVVCLKLNWQQLKSRDV